MRYPVKEPSGVPGSGAALYLYLTTNINVPAELPHMVWYNGMKTQMDIPEKYSFRGFYPIGKTLTIKYGGSESYIDYTFTGQEKNAVFVKDLSIEARNELHIPDEARGDDKVFNQNFLPFDNLPASTKLLNQLPGLALAKSISGWCCQSIGAFYSEKDVLNMLETVCRSATSQEMLYTLHANHVAWCAHSFTISNGVIAPDVKKEFYANNSPDFYVKDIGTIMPFILYTTALLGLDPEEVITWFEYDLWDIDKVAKTIKKDYMKVIPFRKSA